MTLSFHQHPLFTTFHISLVIAASRAGSALYYSYSVASPGVDVVLAVTPLYGDPDLYVSLGPNYFPSRTNYTWIAAAYETDVLTIQVGGSSYLHHYPRRPTPPNTPNNSANPPTLRYDYLFVTGGRSGCSRMLPAVLCPRRVRALHRRVGLPEHLLHPARKVRGNRMTLPNNKLYLITPSNLTTYLRSTARTRVSRRW